MYYIVFYKYRRDKKVKLTPHVSSKHDIIFGVICLISFTTNLVFKTLVKQISFFLKFI